ncbi:MAG: MMPL family transporter [Pseudomonadales bacterium]|nr:MMPL family transporter [Pseudomonadales bacterium]
MLNRYFQWVVYRPWQVLFFTLVITALAGTGLSGFKTTSDPRSFFSPNDPDFTRFSAFESKYGARDAVLIALAPKNGSVFTPYNLAVIEQLTERVWQMPNAVRVQSLANFPHTVVDGDFLDTSFLVEQAAQMSDQQVAAIKAIALNEPTLVDSLVSDSGHVASVLATVMLDERRENAVLVTEWAQALIEEFEQQHPDIDFYLTGTVVFTQAMVTATQDGFKTTLPLAMVASLFTLFLFLRSVLATFYTMMIVSASVISAMGLIVYAGIIFHPISSYASAIILTLGVADCIHILVTHQQQLRQGHSKAEALMESLRVNYQPVFLTSFTTAIGFICLNTSDSPPLRDLGNITAVGVMFAFFFSISMLPAMVMIFPSTRIHEGEGLQHRMMDAVANMIISNRRRFLVATSVVMLVLSAFLPTNKFNDVWHEYFDETFQIRQHSDFIAENLTGFQRVDFSIPAIDQGGISEPEYLAAIEAFNQWAEQQPEVSHASSYSDVIKRLNRNMHEGDQTFYAVPEDRALASQYLLLYEMSLPFGMGLDNQITMDKDETLFTVVLYRTTSASVLEFVDKAEAWLNQNFPGYMKVEATGLDRLFSEIGFRNSVSMIGGTLMALLLISTIIMVALRSVRYGLLSLIPNLLPAGMAFGVWGMVDGNINLSTSIVACITLGVVVDDTVHFLSKYVRAKREQNLNTEQAVQYAFKTVGVALVSTSVILVVNFGVMSFSSFAPTASLGLLTAITIVMALAVDFFFFAPLLLAMDARKNQKVAEGKKPEPSENIESNGLDSTKMTT